MTAPTPTPITWTPGILSIGDLNRSMRDNLDFMLSPPLTILRADKGGQLTSDSVVYGTSSTDKAVVWDTVVVDRDSGWDRGSRYTAQRDGWYHCISTLQYASDDRGADGALRNHQLRKNGVKLQSAGPADADTIAQLRRHSPRDGAFAKGYTMSGQAPLVAGDWVEVYTMWDLTNAGKDPTLAGYDGVSYFGSQFEIRWVSKL